MFCGKCLGGGMNEKCHCLEETFECKMQYFIFFTKEEKVLQHKLCDAVDGKMQPNFTDVIKNKSES